MPSFTNFEEMPIEGLQLAEGDMWYHVGESCEAIEPIFVGGDKDRQIWFEIRGRGWVKRVNSRSVAQVKHRRSSELSRTSTMQ